MKKVTFFTNIAVTFLIFNLWIQQKLFFKPEIITFPMKELMNRVFLKSISILMYKDEIFHEEMKTTFL